VETVASKMPADIGGIGVMRCPRELKSANDIRSKSIAPWWYRELKSFACVSWWRQRRRSIETINEGGCEHVAAGRELI